MSDGSIQSIVCKDMCVGYRPLDDSDPPKNAVSKHISFEVHRGELMAVMGPSGAGKSTLLRGLLGRAPHAKGSIRINGHECGHRGLATVSHKVGLVPQADVLVDELSMRENIRYFHTIAVDSGLTSAEVESRAEKELAEMGIQDDPSQPARQQLTRKRVGDGSGRKSNISGGQAKRANIAMELVNDPDVLIIDEPTSGLSSHDSLELLTKLKEIARSGKIVIIIIHQPSSDIFSLFDRVLLLDAKGHCVRSGTRKEVAQWADEQISAVLRCTSCGSWFPDKILSLVEKKEGGWATESRVFANQFSVVEREPLPLPRKPVMRPFQAWLDLLALFQRNLLIKLRDRSSFALSFLAPPLLGVLFASVFSAAPPDADYSFAQNGLFPQLVFMLIICALFLGMVSAAVEVIRDRPMLEREASRGLKLWAYFGTKFASIMLIALIQAALLAVSAAYMAGAMHLLTTLFGVLTLVMALGASLGLLVSVFSHTATKAFYLVLLILLPQIVLGGALLPYRDMGKALYLGEKKVAEKRPLAAALMPASWAHQFAMRLIAEQSQQQASASPMNLAVADLRHIPQGGFISLKPSRQLKEQPLSALNVTLPEQWVQFSAKPYAEDGMVLIGITLASLLIGWAHISTPYRLGRRANAQRAANWALALVAVPWTVTALAVATPQSEGPPVPAGVLNFAAVAAPMNLNAAAQHCAALKSSLPLLHEFIDIYTARPQALVAGTYWVANDALAQTVSVVDLAALTRLAPDKRNVAAVRATKGVLVAKINPLQKHRFVCLPLPRSANRGVTK